MCEMLSGAAPDDVVFEDDLFRAIQIGQVPGFIMFATKEHVGGVDGLSDAAAGALGPVTRQLVAAIRSSSDAERVHVVYLGEHAIHFHFALLARRPGETALFTNGPLLAALESDADAQAAAATRAAIRDKLSAAPTPS
jgi:diadenosine tetraphosphate (Ap4A) HIT family hydrolase